MNRNKQTEILGGIITVIVLILLIFLSNVEVNKLSYLESAASSIINPIQRVFIDLRNKIQGNSAYFSNMETIMQENEELKKKNSELETILREFEMLKAENTTLQEYMNLTDKYSSYQTIPAYVINKDVSNFSSTLILNVGTKDGIRENMTVIADKGLVGHIISVTENTCKVQVIIDSASTVSSSISTTNDSIICKGTLENDQILRASYIPTGAELIQGDSVYTSGIGGIYPKGIVIGTVKEIITTSNITDRYAIVEPAVDFSKIDTVLIINE
ncbi:MAG: rod shape-determining protein MreC [Clostridia bacterium]|nr:rod shape-determining protein MreC [Clostridia bacterium]